MVGNPYQDIGEILEGLDSVDAVPGDKMTGFVRFNIPRGRVLYAAA
ncbi:MAG: hypothetical protein V1913_04340 [Fibrobacterota bacterium]